MNQLTPHLGADLEELIGELAEDFAQRLMRGERPTVEEYAARHPEASQALRQILPALEIMSAMPVAETKELISMLPTGSRLVREPPTKMAR